MGFSHCQLRKIYSQPCSDSAPSRIALVRELPDLPRWWVWTELAVSTPEADYWYILSLTAYIFPRTRQVATERYRLEGSGSLLEEPVLPDQPHGEIQAKL